MTIPDLPPEIWLEITKYLYPFQIRRLLPLNRALLNIAMDELYGKGRVYNKREFETSRFYAQIKNSPSEVKRRLRHLFLRPHHFGHLLNTTWSVLPKARETKKAFETLAHVENLSSLDLQCLPEDQYEGGFAWTLPFITPILRSSSSTLSTLVLKIPLEAYRDMEAPSLTFPALCNLTVELLTSSSDSEHLESVYLTPFVNNQKSIENLSISSPDETPIISFFSNLDHFPSLSSFKLEFYFHTPPQREKLGVGEFMDKHTSQIRRLDLHLHPSKQVGLTDAVLGDDIRSEQMVRRPPFSTHLPYLHSLSLSTTRQLRAKDIAPYVSRYPKLVEFSMEDKLLTLRELGTIVSQFEGSPLKSLSIYIRFFGPDTIDLLSSKLPHLHRLNVSFDTFVGRGTPDYYGPSSALHSRPHSITTHVEDFTITMKDASWTWDLYRLDFQNVLLDIYSNRTDKGNCYKALFDALPSVVLLNGMDRDEVHRAIRYYDFD